MLSINDSHMLSSPRRLPVWLTQAVPDQTRFRAMKDLIRSLNVHTVCEDAHCPNCGQCWQQGVLTVMILGKNCTRACKFCAVNASTPLPPDPQEPEQIATLVQRLGLRYAVVTSVTRDDLSDGGARHFCQTVAAIRQKMPQTKIEVLIPDFNGDVQSLEQVVAAGPDVISHNIEMAQRLFPLIRPQAEYQRSLGVLKTLKRLNPSGIVKSGLMVGLGETDVEVEAVLKDLATAGCGLVTIGQYLSPSKNHHPVARFVPPEKFNEYKENGQACGIKHVVSGPLVRSSYLAESEYQEFLVKGKG